MLVPMQQMLIAERAQNATRREISSPALRQSPFIRVARAGAESASQRCCAEGCSPRQEGTIRALLVCAVVASRHAQGRGTRDKGPAPWGGMPPAANLEREIELRHTHTQAVQQGGRPEACDSYSKFVVLKKTKIYFCTGTGDVVRHHFRGAGIVIDFYFKTSSATTFSVWPLRKNL